MNLTYCDIQIETLHVDIQKKFPKTLWQSDLSKEKNSMLFREGQPV